MTSGMVQDQNLDKQIQKQMGCMAGFFHLFDRHQILTGRRLYSPKRLPPSPTADSVSQPEEATGSPPTSTESNKQQQAKTAPSPDRMNQSPVTELRSVAPEPATPKENPTKSPLLPVFELKERTRTSWKFSKEAPRLSLDSRAIVDAKGSLHPREIRTNATFLPSNRPENSEDVEKQRKSTSVIARLMGLEPVAADSAPESEKNAELRRSASESRASKDFLQYRFIDPNNFQLKQSQQQPNPRNYMVKENEISGSRPADQKEYNARNIKAEPVKTANRGMIQRKSFFDSADFFPEPKQNVSIYGEIEKRLRMRGIDEPSKDLETLKQILEALQLKGLLHSRRPSSQNQRNFVYDADDSSPIVVMKPARSSIPPNRLGRYGNDPPNQRYAGGRRNPNFVGEGLPTVSPRRERPGTDRNLRNQNRGRAGSPTRSESSMKSPSRRALSVETQRRATEMTEQRRSSPVQSPRTGTRRTAPEHQISSRSPRTRKSAAEIYPKEKIFTQTEDESSTTISDSISTCSQTDTERSKTEEYREGRNLLERCDKLLHSIAELQPSPVSVLDSSFYKEESSPSPVLKRSIDFKDQPAAEVDDDLWSFAKYAEDDSDLAYISDVVRAWKYLPEDSDIFLLLEKQQYLKGKDTSKASTLQRKLIFDTIKEIVERKRQLPPWKVAISVRLDQTIWLEYQRMRDQRDRSGEEEGDLFDVICGVLKKDLSAGDGINGWEDCPIEMSEAVLDIERLIFKDLIGETIRDLAVLSLNCNKFSALCRMLVF